MNRFTKAAAALGLAAAAVVVPSLPASSATCDLGYTIIDNGDGTCDLATLDLTTGELTDLPAASSAEACVADLAADTDGAVWGIAGDSINDLDAVPAATASDISVVAFSTDGTPSSNTVFLPDDVSGSILAYGGIAFDPTLGVLLHIGISGTNATCPSGGGMCLLTYDPETGVATPIGRSDTLSTVYTYLTSCASAVRTMYDPDGQALATIDRTTGFATDGPYLDAPIWGYDCAPGTDTLHAISAAAPSIVGSTPASMNTVGTIDPATGEYAVTAAVSDAAADVYALAVPGETVAPTTTTTAPAPAVAADTVTPAFTG